MSINLAQGYSGYSVPRSPNYASRMKSTHSFISPCKGDVGVQVGVASRTRNGGFGPISPVPQYLSTPLELLNGVVEQTPRSKARLPGRCGTANRATDLSVRPSSLRPVARIDPLHVLRLAQPLAQPSQDTPNYDLARRDASQTFYSVIRFPAQAGSNRSSR